MATASQQSGKLRPENMIAPRAIKWCCRLSVTTAGSSTGSVNSLPGKRNLYGTGVLWGCTTNITRTNYMRKWDT